MRLTRCKSCKAEMLFATSPTGRQIPLVAVEIQHKPLYRVYTDQDGENPRAEKLEGSVWISHFLTCPDASKFSVRPR